MLEMESRFCNPSENKSTSLPYSFEADRITVHVSQGSVVDVEGVDAIVNAAWSDQGGIVGIACVISDKAGNNIIEEYRKYVIKHGSLKEGETLVTSAGKLKYKGIIHCVVPKRWISSVEKAEYVTKLNKTILNIFHEAENHGFFKIAMPAMRADSTASTDCNIYAEVYLKSIEDYCKMRPTHQITDVHFVDIHTDLLLCIRSTCEERKTLSSFQSARGQKGKSRDSSGQVPLSILAADSSPLSPRTPPNRQASLDPRVLETRPVIMARQIRSLSVPNEASLLSVTDQQVSLAHPSPAILGYPIQETSFPKQEFPSYKMNARPRGICLIISNREFVNVSHYAKEEDLRSRDGTEIDSGFEMEADAVVHTTKLIPNEADFLLGYSTVSGYISYRLPGTGSLYIEKLVDMLNRYHKEMDLLGILTTVNDEVSKTDITYQGMHVKQMPQKVSTLRKRLCFQ